MIPEAIKDAIASGAEVVKLGERHAKTALQHCDKDRWLCFEVGSFRRASIEVASL
jgi:hypothetical protein